MREVQAVQSYLFFLFLPGVAACPLYRLSGQSPPHREPRARVVGLPLSSRWWMFGALTGSFALDGSGVSGNLVAVGNLGKPCDVTRLCDNFGRCHTQGVCSVLQPSCAVAGEPL